MSQGIWFTGPVQDAVSLVNQRNCVFLVYIHDDSDKSKILDDTLNNEEIAETIQNHAIALRIEKNSENANLFGQFYPLQTIPILYFIKQGTIKDFGIETITQQEILDKIKTVSLEQQTNVTQSLNTASQDATTESNSLNENNRAAAAKKAEMQKRLEEARKQREEKEKKETKEREVKRRNEAKAMQEAKQTQNDRENQLIMEKLKKDRKEAEDHKRKVREQIARDRAEKLAQRKTDKERQGLPSQQSSEASVSRKRQSHEFSNLNIRLLDGTTIRNQFEASDTLNTVKEWIQENRTDGRKSYKLSAQFPTRLFTEADNDTVLQNLDLCPSATIIMKPVHPSATSLSSQTHSSGGGVFNIARSGFDYVYALVIGLLNFLAGLIEALFPRHGNHPPSTASEQQPFVRNLRGGHRLGGTSSSDTGKSTAVAEKGQKRHSFATRINTIHDEDNSDDEDEKRPTYNGNSVNHE